jgi:hypothetical protein
MNLGEILYSTVDGIYLFQKRRLAKAGNFIIFGFP